MDNMDKTEDNYHPLSGTTATNSGSALIQKSKPNSAN